MVDYKNTSEKGRLGAIAKHKKYSQKGESNPNWKGGRSKDNYYYKKRQVQKFPERVKARGLVNRALKKGILTKPPWCYECGINFKDKRKIQGHHEDYNQPLKVVWLCKNCHWELHR